MTSTSQTILKIEHPVLEHSLSVLRDKTTDTEEFRRHTAVVSQIMIIEATRSLPLRSRAIETPLSPTSGFEISREIVLVPVLRAGISMLFAAKELLSWAPVGFIGLERDEQTAKAREYYQKFPADLAEKHILVLDPMLATGGSLVDTIKALEKKGACLISVVCIVAAPEGIAYLNRKCPGVKIYTAAIDKKLDSSKYIVPGLGDFGDRYFGT